MSQVPDTTTPECDIAIIGAGMVGSVLAALLGASGAGWRVTLLDRQPLADQAAEGYEPGRDHRSTALSAGSVDILSRSGLWSALASHATAIHQVHVSDRGHSGGALLDARQHGRESLGQVLENAWLAPRLQQAARRSAYQVLAPVSVTALHPGRHFTCLQLAGQAANSPSPEKPQPTCLKARLVILADGGSSELPTRLGIRVQRERYGQGALIAQVSFERPHQCRAFERFTADGPLALLPLGERASARRAALVWTLPPARAEQLTQAPAAEFLPALQQAFGWRLGRFNSVGQRQNWPLSLVRAEEQVRSRLVLLGNSAHYLHPVAGQGFNLSVRDAAALASCLHSAWDAEQDPGDLAVLEAYRQSRSRDQCTTIHLSDRLVRLFSSCKPLDMALRHLGLAGLNAVPGAKSLFTSQTMGLLDTSACQARPKELRS